MITYKVKEIALEPKDSLIVKVGGEVEFSIRAVDNDIIYLEKQKKELVAQMGIEEAKKINILGTHPHIENMSEEDRIACYLYQQSFAFCKVGAGKLEEIENQLKEYASEKAEIEKQTGIK